MNLLINGIFSPLQPRSGVFCFLISDVRETTALEMPSRENTFVIKADNNMEYVIEAANSDDMRSWLATIRYCMRSTPTVQVQGVEALTAMPNLTTIPASPPPAATAPSNSTIEGIQKKIPKTKEKRRFENCSFFVVVVV